MNPTTNFIHEVSAFVEFLLHYFQVHLLNYWGRFEKFKDIVVAILVARRGKYSQSFLNTSFFLLISATLIGGPAIAENNPFIGDYLNQNQTANQSVLATDVNSLPVETNISVRPRDKVEDHTVSAGETLASIAKRYEVSVDSIKWASNLKSDIIRPGQIIKIPPVSGIVHKVAAGETVYSIAKKYRTDAQNIVNFPFNDFVDVETFALAQGQILYVPDGIMPEAAPGIIRPRVGPRIAAGTPGTGNFIWPTSGTITQNYIWYHRGVDLANRSLPPVLAADTGTVTYANCVKYGYGCHIILDHANGYQTLYAHLSVISVAVGQGVSRGQQIGQVGSTGRSTGPHLHFEIRSGGQIFNPLSFLK